MQDPSVVVQAARVEELLLKLIDNPTLVMMSNPRDQLQAQEEVPNPKAFDPVEDAELIKCPLLQVSSITGPRFTVNLLKKTNGLQSKSLILFSIMKNKSSKCKERQRDVV